MPKRSSIFNTVRTEGAILPAELLQRIVSGDATLEGLKPTDYHLSPGERLGEAATRSWNRLIGVWQTYRDLVDNLSEEAIGTTETRERWLLPLFQELGYGRLQTQRSIEIEGKIYPISHKATEPVAIHLVSFKWDLDKRNPIAKGETKLSPHSLMQEYLNSSDDHLWGILSNGYKLRILRDNVSLTRVAYVEFDLQAMMDGLAYSDFFLLFLLCHQSRVEVKTDETGRLLPPETCWLEKWYNTSIKDGVRALDDLRNNVQSAIESLGAGFLSHPGNTNLRDKLRSGTLTLQDYYHQVLLQVYRLLFIFVAEDRDLLIPNDVPDKVKQTYLKYYSTYRIRELASKKRGTRHSDLCQQLVLVFKGLYDGNTALGLPALGSFLFSDKSTQDLSDIAIANCDLLRAIRFLCYTQQNNIFQSINYRNLGSEELGSVYESLLEMHPEINLDAGYFKLNLVSGSERKTTGSYYTPSSLVNCLLDSALEPVIDNALKSAVDAPAKEQALLNLKICDPAAGSGHFLISAAHRIAKRLAAIRAGEDEPAPSVIHHALRDVISRCIYGVDLNPMAVELCKISLWMEALEPGKPLTFLDHHIQCGNSLLGCTPALLKRGIPDAAFTPLIGDDKAYCAKYKKRNKEERDKDVMDIFSGDEKPWEHLDNHSPDIINLNKMDDSNIDALHKKEDAYAELMQSSGYLSSKFIFDSWCAAFVWKKAPSDQLPYPITQQLLDIIKTNPDSANPVIRKEIMRLAAEYQFVHWHIAFPDVFLAKLPSDIFDKDVTGWLGGFDCILGNPPYGDILMYREKLITKVLYPDSFQTSNTAADFICLSMNIGNELSKSGFVVPKSFTYSFSWLILRNKMLSSLVQVIDVGLGWKDVLLEQILITYKNSNIYESRQIAKLGKMLGNFVEYITNDASKVIETLGIIPTDINQVEYEIIKQIHKNASAFLGSICTTNRGMPLQRFCKSYGDVPILGGKDIRDLKTPAPRQFILNQDLPEGSLIEPPVAVFQNIVAYVSKPIGHIKLIGTVLVERYALLDTVNILKLKDIQIDAWGVTAYLLSDLVNWYVHVCIYNKAVRTMHFDGYFLNKIPIPSTSTFQALSDIGKNIMSKGSSMELWDELNSIVFNSFEVDNRSRSQIQETRKQRYK